MPQISEQLKPRRVICVSSRDAKFCVSTMLLYSVEEKECGSLGTDISVDFT
ncbi:MAG TPA: hypothetical protein VI387_10290 [Candidatus Brocadiales bacterium]|nr:hypothetical protein [Candidatus Brocadiales bacterium]